MFKGVIFGYFFPMAICLLFWLIRSKWPDRYVITDYLAAAAFALAFIPAANWLGVFAVVLWSLMDLGAYLAKKVSNG